MTGKSVPYSFETTPQILKILHQIVKYVDDYFADQTGEPIVITTIYGQDDMTFANCSNVQGLMEFLESEELIEIDPTYHTYIKVPNPPGRDKGIAVPDEYKLRVLRQEPIQHLLNELEGGVSKDGDIPVRYSRQSGIISRGEVVHRFADEDYKKLIDFLWNKRCVKTRAWVVREPKPVALKRLYSEVFDKVLNNDGKARLINMIDVFNLQMKRKNLPARIKRRGGAYIEINAN